VDGGPRAPDEALEQLVNVACAEVLLSDPSHEALVVGEKGEELDVMAEVSGEIGAGVAVDRVTGVSFEGHDGARVVRRGSGSAAPSTGIRRYGPERPPRRNDPRHMRPGGR
jgi:hypothetical protein